MKPFYSLTLIFISALIAFGYMGAKIMNTGYNKAISENAIVINENNKSRYLSQLIIENRDSISPH